MRGGQVKAGTLPPPPAHGPNTTLHLIPEHPPTVWEQACEELFNGVPLA